MKYQDFYKQTTSGSFAPVYLFHGDEHYFVDQGVEAITSKFVSDKTADFNRDVFYGEESEATQILNAVLSFPMMAEKRVVVVKNYHRLAQSGKELLSRYCRKPAQHSILILIAKSVDFRKKANAELKKLAVVVECRPPYENQVPSLVSQYVQKNNGRITFGAIRLLQSKLGNSMKEIMGEIDKLLGYLSDGEEISEAAVEKLVGISRNYNVYELRDAIGERDKYTSLQILRQMVETGESPVYLVTSLTGFFTQIWRLREMRRNKLGKNDISKRLGIHPFYYEKTARHARNFDDREIVRNLELLLDADHKLKTSYQKPHIVIELLVLQLLEEQGAAWPA